MEGTALVAGTGGDLFSGQWLCRFEPPPMEAGHLNYNRRPPDKGVYLYETLLFVAHFFHDPADAGLLSVWIWRRC